MHPSRQFPGLSVIHMPSCLHVLLRVIVVCVPSGGGGVSREPSFWVCSPGGVMILSHAGGYYSREGAGVVCLARALCPISPYIAPPPGPVGVRGRRAFGGSSPAPLSLGLRAASTASGPSPPSQRPSSSSHPTRNCLPTAFSNSPNAPCQCPPRPLSLACPCALPFLPFNDNLFSSISGFRIFYSFDLVVVLGNPQFGSKLILCFQKFFKKCFFDTQPCKYRIAWPLVPEGSACHWAPFSCRVA